MDFSDFHCVCNTRENEHFKPCAVTVLMSSLINLVKCTVHFYIFC